jgi:hypothetical protein
MVYSYSKFMELRCIDRSNNFVVEFMFRLVNRTKNYLNMSSVRDHTIILVALACLSPSRLDHKSYKCKLRIAGRHLRIAGTKLRNAGTDLWITGTDLWVTGTDLWVTGTNLWITGTDLRIAGIDLRITGTELRITGTELRIAGTDLQSLQRTLNNIRFQLLT